MSVKPGGYAAENDRVQQDVKTFAQKLLADKAAGTSPTADLDAFHTAYTKDSGISTSPTDIDLELGEIPGLSQSDITTLASIASREPTED